MVAMTLLSSSQQSLEEEEFVLMSMALHPTQAPQADKFRSTKIFLGALLPRHRQPRAAAGQVIGQRETDQDHQPEETGGGRQDGHARAGAHVHEEEEHEDGFGDRDGQRYDVVRPAEIHLRDQPGDDREDDQRGEDQEVDLARGDVLSHASSLHGHQRAACAPSR